MKKILILGTGSAQRDIIKYCKENNYFVIATSNVAGYSAQRLADEFYQVDITDTSATEKLANEIGVDLVYSVGSDVAMPTIAYVSKSLGLPCFVEHETAVLCNHKNLLREIMSRDGGCTGSVPFQILESATDKINISFPVMMKPSDSQGQRGVRKVDNLDDVQKYFNETMSFSREKKVIIESFIEGDEVSVNVFLMDGEIKFYLMSDREVWDEYPGGIIREHVIPSKYEKDKNVSEAVKKLVEDVLNLIGLKNGPAYFQIKIDHKGHPYLIEVTPRLDGCHMWRAIKYSTGIDLLQASIDALEQKVYSQSLSYDVVPYRLEFLCGKPGDTFHKSNYNVPDNVYIQWYYEEGQKINRMNGYFEKCGYVIKKGTD